MDILADTSIDWKEAWRKPCFNNTNSTVIVKKKTNNGSKTQSYRKCFFFQKGSVQII